MKLITKKDKIDNAAKLYRNNNPYYSWKGNIKDRDIYNRLLEAKTEEEIVNILGSKYYTKNICSECMKDKDILVELADFGYDGYYAICKSCLNKVKDLFAMAGLEV